MSNSPPQLAYLFSRHPVVSQTFCDTEIMALETMGFKITIGSLNPPTTSFRHERLVRLRAESIYPPPNAILDLATGGMLQGDPLWGQMRAMAAEHDLKYGAGFKSLTRARNAWHYAREFKQRGIRHVHVHFANRATHTALFLKLAGMTFSFTAHAQDFMIDLGSNELLQEMARGAEFVIAVSEFSAGLLREICPEAAGKIKRIYNGLDPAAFDPASVSSGQNKILSVGRLIEFKGFQHLIPAVAKLHQQNIPAQLEIVGEGPMRQQLQALIESLGMQDHIRLLGMQSQEVIKRLLVDCDVFALPCIIDSKGACDILPTVITEAMASGKPVVSTRLAGVPEMVEHGVTGLLAEPGNEADLTHCLARVLTGAGNMGSAARRRFEDIFALEKTSAQLAENLWPLAVESRVLHSRTLVLLDSWPPQSDAADRELDYLQTRPDVRMVAGNAAHGVKPSSLAGHISFLPHAMVLESAWRNNPALAAYAESLCESCGPVNSEHFFRESRRAIYLASMLEKWSIRHVHAFRSDAMLCAWLLRKLTGISASATIETKPTLARAAAEIMGKDFQFGSLADPKIKLPWGDPLGLAEPAARGSGLFKKAAKPQAPVPAEAWTDWLELALR